MGTKLYEHEPASLSPVDKILEASTRVIAVHGFEGATFRQVSEAADVSVGQVQYYFKTRDKLVAATNDYVLKQLSTKLESAPLPEVDPLTEVGRRLVGIFVEQPHLIDFLSQSIVDKGDVGREMFHWLYGLSVAQGEMFAAKGMLAPNLDKVWAALHPLILRIGAFILSDFIDELLDEPFASRAGIERWENSVRQLIRHGQLNERATPGNNNDNSP